MLFLKGDFRDPQSWYPLTESFPYYSHIYSDSNGNGMGKVWEAYHKGVPEIPLIFGGVAGWRRGWMGRFGDQPPIVDGSEIRLST